MKINDSALVACFAATACLFVTALALAGGPFEIVRSTIDGGGVMLASGGAYTLSGTVGQPDAGQPAGGAYALTGGFWFGEPVGACDATGTVTLGDYVLLADCLFGPDTAYVDDGCACFDTDTDGDIDLLDYARFGEAFNG